MAELNENIDSGLNTKDKIHQILNRNVGSSKVNFGLLILVGACIWAMYELISCVLFFFNK